MAAAPVPKAGAGRDASGARPNWSTIAASSDEPSARSPAKGGNSRSTRENGATRTILTATPALQDLIHPHTSLGRKSDKVRTGKAVRQATQVVTGNSLQSHAPPTNISPTGQHNPSSKRHTHHPAPPSVSQDAKPSPPKTKDQSVRAGKRYNDVRPLLLS